MSEPGLRTDGARGIVIAHGRLAEGLVDAVRRIAGCEPGVLVPVSNDNRSRDALCSEVDRLARGRPTVIFTDLASGSCHVAARVSQARSPERIVVTGVNLPMLLDFVFNRGLPLPELADRLGERGRRGISSFIEPHDANHPVSR